MFYKIYYQKIYWALTWILESTGAFPSLFYRISAYNPHQNAMGRRSGTWIKDIIISFMSQLWLQFQIEILPNHVQSLLGKGCLVMDQNSVQIFIMTPRHGDIGKSAVLFIDSEFSAATTKKS